MKDMQLAIVSVTAVLLLVILFLYRSFTAKKLKALTAELKRAKEQQHMTTLQLLQAQVNPHFLYNTLEAILWLAEADKRQESVYMLERLSAFYRISLSKGEDIIPLKEEIEHTKSYMEIQQMRFRDIMEYEIVLPRELEEIRLPKLTLQPLAENALYHGIQKKRGKGRIRIVCQKQEEDILLIVEDNGIGMKPEKQKELEQTLNKEKTPAGFGLMAVHERLRLYYGADYGVKVISKYGEGTRIEVLISKDIGLVKEEETC